MEKKEKPGYVRKAWRKIQKSLAGRGNCQTGKIDLRTERKIKARDVKEGGKA